MRSCVLRSILIFDFKMHELHHNYMMFIIFIAKYKFVYLLNAYFT
ncbi:hypothetical protein SSYIS1_13260 [Serratia symbiotica]|uniref:Uncharacterized protein n=1 Tax=Serratia symbiotica TaxID=138074 RepID=A0A455VMI1_9GAMM|nr:hypothetical protein SSYIS1_13260 [Serratia symbiotica]